MARPIRITAWTLPRTAAIVVTLAGFTFTAGPPASAITPAPLTFSTNVQKVSGPSTCPGFPVLVEGTSAASGVINDTFTVDDCAHFGSNTLHIQRTLQSGNGVIGMTVNGKGTGPTPGSTTATYTGTWAIVSGSGAYATLSGQGTFTAKVDVQTETSMEAESGQAHFA
jgi:hypothetical protein